MIISVFRKEFDLVDKKLARVELLFYSALSETERQGSWGTRVCELYITLETSKEILKLRQKQAKEKIWSLHQKNVQPFGERPENPVLYEEYKHKERERNKRRKEMGDQNRKSILEMSTRAQRKKRREWRTAQRNERKRDRDLNKCLPETPLNSPPIQELVMRRAEC